MSRRPFGLDTEERRYFAERARTDPLAAARKAIADIEPWFSVIGNLERSAVPGDVLDQLDIVLAELREITDG